MRAARSDSAVFHHEDEVGIFDGGDTLSDDYLCRFGDKFAEARTDESVRFCIDGACRVVENEYFRLFQQCAGNAESLLLTARNIRAALLNLSLVAIGK